MSINLDSYTRTASTQDATAPLTFLILGFNDVVRLSSRSSMLWGTDAYLAADFTVKGSTKPVISIFNDSAGVGAAVLSQGTAGRSVDVWTAYRHTATGTAAPIGYTAPRLLFRGEMSRATVGDRIEIQCKQGAPQFTPRVRCAPPVCNYLPAAGTRIQMPAQVYILE